MTRKAIPKYQMLLRVRDFGGARRDLFPARSVAGKLFAAVAAAADALQQHDSTELAASGGEQDAAASKVAARAALRHQVRAIARTAAAAEMPELGATFRVSLDCNDERLLSQARTLLQEAKPFAGTFVAHELRRTSWGSSRRPSMRSSGRCASGRQAAIIAWRRGRASRRRWKPACARPSAERDRIEQAERSERAAGIASWNRASHRLRARQAQRAATPDGRPFIVCRLMRRDLPREAPGPWSFVRPAKDQGGAGSTRGILGAQ
jgi:hypothetical protein